MNNLSKDDKYGPRTAVIADIITKALNATPAKYRQANVERNKEKPYNMNRYRNAARFAAAGVMGGVAWSNARKDSYTKAIEVFWEKDAALLLAWDAIMGVLAYDSLKESDSEFTNGMYACLVRSWESVFGQIKL